MKIRALGLATTLALFSATTPVQAQDLDKHTLTLGVERLYGITYTSEAVTLGEKVRTTAVNYSLFSNPTSSQRSVYSSPRLAADFLITESWSAGLGMGLVGGSTKTTSDELDQEGPNIFGLILAPRAGYLLAQNSWFAFWPKAGFTYKTLSTNTGVGQFRGALTVEASALLLPSEHIILSFAPTFDWGLFGANKAPTGDSNRAVALEAGFQGGLGVYF